MRRTSVICRECGAAWDARTAGFCGWCGALLDSPAAPTATTRERKDPRERRASRSERASKATVTVGVVGLLAALVAGMVISRDVEPMEDVGVDLPADVDAADPNTARDGEVIGMGHTDDRPRCERPDTDEPVVECMLWERAWSVETGPYQGRHLRTAPTVHGIAVVEDGSVRVVDPVDGAITWDAEVDLSSRDYWPSTLDAEHVVVAEENGTTVIDVADRSIERWARLTGQYYPVQPSIDGTVAQVTRERADDGTPVHTLLLRSLDDGTVRWRQQFPDVPSSQALTVRHVDAGLLVSTCCMASDEATTAWLLDPATGAIQWSLEDIPPVWDFGDGTLVSLQWPQTDESGTTLSALDAETGATLWTLENFQPGEHVEIFSVGELLILSQLHGGGLRALDRRTGQLRWEHRDASGWVVPTTDRFLLEREDQHRLVLEGDGGVIRRLDPATGELLWSQGKGLHGATIYEDRIYALGPDGVVILDLIDGDVRLRVTAQNANPVQLEPLVVYSPGRLFRVDTAFLDPKGT